MILGYDGIIAVPTGIVSVELQAATKRKLLDRTCSACNLTGHQQDASFCRNCGKSLGNWPMNVFIRSLTPPNKCFLKNLHSMTSIEQAKKRGVSPWFTKELESNPDDWIALHNVRRFHESHDCLNGFGTGWIWIRLATRTPAWHQSK